jgi:hypothetical protein
VPKMNPSGKLPLVRFPLCALHPSEVRSKTRSVAATMALNCSPIIIAVQRERERESMLSGVQVTAFAEDNEICVS